MIQILYLTTGPKCPVLSLPIPVPYLVMVVVGLLYLLPLSLTVPTCPPKLPTLLPILLPPPPIQPANLPTVTTPLRLAMVTLCTLLVTVPLINPDISVRLLSTEHRARMRKRMKLLTTPPPQE